MKTYKILKHDDGSYGFITGTNIRRVDVPQLLGNETQIDQLEKYFSIFETKNKENPIKGWNLVDVNLVEL